MYKSLQKKYFYFQFLQNIYLHISVIILLSYNVINQQKWINPVYGIISFIIIAVACILAYIS